MHTTIDLTDEQINYLRGLLAVEVADRTRELRGPSFGRYGPMMQQNVHEDLRLATSIIGVLPPSRITAQSDIPMLLRRQAD